MKQADKLLEHAKNDNDKRQGILVRSKIPGAQTLLRQAIQEALHYSFPARSNAMTIIWELHKTKRAQKQSQQCLKELPLIMDKTKLELVRFLSKVAWYAWWGKMTDLCSVTWLRLAHLTFKFGLSGPVVFMVYGRMGSFDEIDKAFELGETCTELFNRAKNSKRSWGRAQFWRFMPLRII